ncbi:nucleolar protein 6 Mat89Ba [Megalopta genalis]|uniref:nucleolar protein 6 Mat89Ba n=1 Tax=Megalopta genalis TaxID=115081 RepID=UPI003FD3FF3F
MKGPYKPNISALMSDSNDGSGTESDNYSNDETDKIEEDYQEALEDKGDEIQEDSMQEVTRITSEKKRKKVTDDVTDVIPGKKKKLHKELYKQPTVEELNQLRETENLFHSNLFRLQIEEMLNEVRIKDKYKRLFEAWFKQFEKTVNSIKETEEYELSDRTLKKELKVHIPKLNIRNKTKAVFKFLKPSQIAVIGSYGYNAIVGPNITVDVMIEMPAKMFRKLDYKNYTYIKKKAIYLAYIASNITDDIAEERKFVGDHLRPILKIVPTGKLGTKINVLVHITAQEESFKLNRFQAEKNGVRPKFFSVKAANECLPPTPHYNSIILRDLVASRTNSKILNIIKEYPNLRDGIMLLKIWLTQRELTKGYEGFSGHIMTMFVLYLLSIQKLNTFMSSYQIVRNVWHQLVQVSWHESGITMSQDEDSRDRVSIYKNYYDCVFLDSTGYYNIASYLSKSTFSWIQREAELCLHHLDSAHVDSFQSLFMRKVSFYKAFDHVIRLKGIKKNCVFEILKSVPRSNDDLDYGPNYRSRVIKIIYNVLKQGLTNRVQYICVLPEDFTEWECTKKRSNYIGDIFIGLELNPEFCFNVVDKGPEANLPEAAEFRKFWGTNSELRRFKDGSIQEAVVWASGKSMYGKRIICRKIAIFLLLKKLHMRNGDFTYIAHEMEEVLLLEKVHLSHFLYGTGEGASLKVINAFNNLEKQLMDLTDIPLSIHGVQGASAVFRYTDVFPPIATVHKPDNKLSKESKNCLILSDNITNAPKYVTPLDVCLQLSLSGKWPDELEAFRKTKAAFYIQIAECLRKQNTLVANANYSHLDVYKEGFVFRLRIAHQKEISCVKQQITEDGIKQYIDNDESIELESKLFELPKLTSALHGLHVQQPSFGTACCITKRWLSAQLLDDSHIPDVVVELLVASMYLTPAPYRPPQLPQVAFLRMLEIFARGHWTTDPVIVNFNNEMTKEEIVAVETLFGSSRKSLPPLFISTPYDQQKSLWTKKAPTNLVLNRITALARQSLKLYEGQICTKVFLDVKPLFRPALTEYDCLIHLKPVMVPRRRQAIDVSEYSLFDVHPYKYHTAQKIPIVDFDPVQFFLKELRNGYDEFALFFHDTYGGTVIGVLFKPSALESKDFKVTNVSCCKLNDDDQLLLNVSAMVQDFYILGKDLIESINVQSKRFSLE